MIQLGVELPGRTLLFVATAGVVIAGVTLMMPQAWLQRAPLLVGALVSAPLLTALVAWSLSPRTVTTLPSTVATGFDGPILERLESSAAANSLVFLVPIALVGVAGALAVLVLLDAGEVARARTDLAMFISARPRLAHWSALAAALLAKVVLLILGYLGWLPGSLERGGTWDRGTLPQWLYAVAMASIGAVAFRSFERRPLARSGLRQMSAVAIAGFAAAGISAVATSLFLASAGALVRGSWVDPFNAVTGDLTTTLARRLPLLTVLAAGALGLWWLRRQRCWTDGALLGAALLVWGVLPAAELFFGAPSPSEASFTASPQHLDVVITAALVFVAARHRATIAPARLLCVLIVSTLVAFGGQLLPGELEHRLFLLALVLPVVWRFVIDTEDLRDDPPGATVTKVVVWSVILALSTLAVAAGQLTETIWAPSQRIGWRLFVIPLAFVLLARRAPVTQQPATTPRRQTLSVAAVFTSSSASSRPKAERWWMYAIGGIVGIAVVTAAVLGLQRSVAYNPIVSRPAHRVDVRLLDDWLPCGVSRGDGEAVLLVRPDEAAVIVAVHSGTDNSVVEPSDCGGGGEVALICPIGAELLPPQLPVGVSEMRRVSVRGVSGVEYSVPPGDGLPNGARTTCAMSETGGSRRRITLVNRRPTDPSVSIAIDDAAAQLEFNSG